MLYPSVEADLIKTGSSKAGSTSPSSRRKLGSILTLIFSAKAKIKMGSSLRWNDEQEDRIDLSVIPARKPR
ncbi:MAG: hypothetical protein LH470_11335 [Lysobacter sp.]|nr:hypothetical protein [Lysobacter sp.]